MAIAVDSSSPVRWAGTSLTVASASFTAPTDALLVVCVSGDGTTSITATVSDSGSLTWTVRVTRDNTETTSGGCSFIATARTTSSVSRTVSVGLGAALESARKSAKLYVLTGVDVDGTPVDTVGASNEGGASTNNLTTSSVTPGATGLLVCCDTDWNQLGSYQASSDLTQDTADYTGQISVCSGYKTCSSGVGVTGNLNAAGTSAAQHKWTQIVVRESGAAPTSRPIFRRRTRFFLRWG